MRGKESTRMLIENKWEKYDPERMRKLKTRLVTIILIFLWFVEFWAFSIMFKYSFYYQSPYSMGAIAATIITVLAFIIAFILLRRVDVEKVGWYFSAYMDKSLRWENMLNFMRNFLRENNYIYREKPHKVGNLKITYFEPVGKDFKIRLWFTNIGGTPIVEIGIGPENDSNKDEIGDLRRRISESFKKRFSGEM